MSPKSAFLVLLSLVTSLAVAQSVSLNFPDNGDRQVWATTGLPSEPPTDADGIRTMKSDAALPTTGLKPSAAVFIWDRKTGNLASKTVKDASNGTWTVKPTDYLDIAEVTVHVEHAGKPVAAATVDLDDGRRKITQLIAPSSSGVATFFAVKPGSLKITVHFKLNGKEGKPLTQLLDAPLTRTDAIPSATISLADSVDTVSPTAPSSPGSATGSPASSPATGTTDGKPKDTGGGSILGQIIVYLIALGGMGAAIYFGLQYMKKNPDSVGAKLEQLGVQIPKPGDDPLTNPAPVPLPKTPAPVQKIILDDAQPDLITPIATSQVITNPRLVSSTGDALSIPEGDLVVGREVGLGLSLVGETTVSRKHAQVSRQGSTVTVKDFGSTNGTFVNGIPVQGEQSIRPGDAVQFGSVKFRFEG